MDKKYTLEDVEALREKSGISYEEAVALLDKYDGDMSRALIELEKRGKLGDKKTRHTHSTDGFIAWAKHILSLTITTRIHITRDEKTIVNLTLLFLIAFVCLAPWLAVVSVILIFLLGLRVNVIKDSDMYATETLRSMVDGAAESIKANVDNLTAKREKPADGESANMDEPEREQDEIKRPQAAPEKGEGEDEDYESITIE